MAETIASSVDPRARIGQFFSELRDDQSGLPQGAYEGNGYVRDGVRGMGAAGATPDEYIAGHTIDTARHLFKRVVGRSVLHVLTSSDGGFWPELCTAEKFSVVTLEINDENPDGKVAHHEVQIPLTRYSRTSVITQSMQRVADQIAPNVWQPATNKDLLHFSCSLDAMAQAYQDRQAPRPLFEWIDSA